jgi:alkylation response protein AidB-like acyl-CoA dehydrogenase
MINGSDEFCQEFLTDVRIPIENLVGTVDEGWVVGTRWMFHERNGSGGGSQFTIGTGNGSQSKPDDALGRVAAAQNLGEDPWAMHLVAQGRVFDIVYMQLVARLTAGIRSGVLNPNIAGLLKMFRGFLGAYRATAAIELAGRDAVLWPMGDSQSSFIGDEFLMRQTSSIGGGTVEMSRNVVSERVLGMPREIVLDRGRPFSEVQRSASSAARRK